MDNKCVEKLLETVAFSNGCICSVELIRWEHTHFHPSGNCAPSSLDVQITENLRKCGELLGIPVKDHIIIGSGKAYYSFLENGLLKQTGKSTDRKSVV